MTSPLADPDIPVESGHVHPPSQDRTPHGSPLSSHDFARDQVMAARQADSTDIDDKFRDPTVAAAYGIREIRDDASPNVANFVQETGGLVPEDIAQARLAASADAETAAHEETLAAEAAAADAAALAAANDVSAEPEPDEETQEAAAQEMVSQADVEAIDQAVADEVAAGSAEDVAAEADDSAESGQE